MNDLIPKKLSLIRILNILEKYSDENHPLKQEQIAKYLSDVYGLELERKAIGSNLALLKDIGYEIVSDRHGSYLAERTFEDSEIRMLIDGVLSSKYITAKQSKDLIDKLCSLSNIYFRSNVKHIYSVNDWSKTKNSSVFYNIDLISEAIETKRQIKFDYNKYGIDKKLHKSSDNIVSPYQLILHNQRYFLLSYNEDKRQVVNYRIDHITNIEISDKVATDIHTIKAYKSGLDYKKLSTAFPYMFTDEPEWITFAITEDRFDHVIDWFGYDLKAENQDGKIKVTVTASPNAFEYWAMQYLNYVEVLSPIKLRDKIIENLKQGYQKYTKG